MSSGGVSIPDVPSAVYGLVCWCVERGHWQLVVHFHSLQRFTVEAHGPGMNGDTLLGDFWSRELRAVAALSQDAAVTSRRQGELTTWRVPYGGAACRCAQPLKSPGLRIDISGLFHATPTRRGPEASLHNMLQVLNTCLQHLAIAAPQLRVQLHSGNAAVGDQCTAKTVTKAVGDSTHDISATTSRPAWIADAPAFEVLAASGASQLCGHVAPFASTASPLQLLAVNGWPVQLSAVHHLLQRVHTSLNAGVRRRPTSLTTGNEPCYALHMRFPSAELFWCGPPLQRQVEFADTAMAEALAACALHHFWRQHMPATVLSAVEEKMRYALEAQRPAAALPMCRAAVPAPQSAQWHGPGGRSGLLQHAAALLHTGAQATSEAEIALPLHEAAEQLTTRDRPPATRQVERQAVAKVAHKSSDCAATRAPERPRVRRTIGTFLQDPSAFEECAARRVRRRATSASPCCGTDAAEDAVPSSAGSGLFDSPSDSALAHVPVLTSPALQRSYIQNAAMQQATPETLSGGLTLLSSQLPSSLLTVSTPQHSPALLSPAELPLLRDSSSDEMLSLDGGSLSFVSSVSPGRTHSAHVQRTSAPVRERRNGSVALYDGQRASPCALTPSTRSCSPNRQVAALPEMPQSGSALGSRLAAEVAKQVGLFAPRQSICVEPAPLLGSSTPFASIDSQPNSDHPRPAAVTATSQPSGEHCSLVLPGRAQALQRSQCQVPETHTDSPAMSQSPCSKGSTADNVADHTGSSEQRRGDKAGTSSGDTQARPTIDLRSGASEQQRSASSARMPTTLGSVAAEELCDRGAVDLFKARCAQATTQQMQHQPILQAGDVLATVPCAQAVERRHLESAHVLAQMSNKVLIVRSGNGLLAVDQHAADERIQLELLQAGLEAGVREQQSPVPEPAAWRVRSAPLACCLLDKQQGSHLTWRQRVVAAQYKADVEAWGWRLCAAADSQSLDVLAVPVIFGHVLPVSALSSFLDTIGCASCGARRRRTPDVVQTLLQSVACRSAVMFGQRLTRCEGAGIVCALARARLPMHCAHGRPTAAHVVDLAPLLATLQALRHRRPGLGERGVCKQRCGVASRLAATLMAMRQS